MPPLIIYERAEPEQSIAAQADIFCVSGGCVRSCQPYFSQPSGVGPGRDGGGNRAFQFAFIQQQLIWRQRIRQRWPVRQYGRSP